MADDQEKDGTLGRIALKQVRVSRAESQARRDRGAARGRAQTSPGRRRDGANALVPYLDLFFRLTNTELAKLAGVEVGAVDTIRSQILDVHAKFDPWQDLLERLNDDELSRLTGESSKLVRFWRMSQPRAGVRTIEALAAVGGGAVPASVAPAASKPLVDLGPTPVPHEVEEDDDLDFGLIVDDDDEEQAAAAPGGPGPGDRDYF